LHIKVINYHIKNKYIKIKKYKYKVREKFVPNHLHLLVKGYILNTTKDENYLNSFFINLVKKVKMKVLSGPTSICCNDYGNEGITGIVVLSTSHSSMHIWDAESPAMFQFDLYSCANFTVDDVLEELNKSFTLVIYSYWFIDRNGNEFKLIEKSN
jgi:S-adenosylmethionine/arginine decarboxylase-like enzyme